MGPSEGAPGAPSEETTCPRTDKKRNTNIHRTKIRNVNIPELVSDFFSSSEFTIKGIPSISEKAQSKGTNY